MEEDRDLLLRWLSESKNIRAWEDIKTRKNIHGHRSLAAKRVKEDVPGLSKFTTQSIYRQVKELRRYYDWFMTGSKEVSFSGAGVCGPLYVHFPDNVKIQVFVLVDAFRKSLRKPRFPINHLKQAEVKELASLPAKDRSEMFHKVWRRFISKVRK